MAALMTDFHLMILQAQRKEQAQNWSPQSVSASPAAWYNFHANFKGPKPPPNAIPLKKWGFPKTRGKTPKMDDLYGNFY